MTCGMCGRHAPNDEKGGQVPLTWATSVERGRRVVICDRCARENLRNIETKLDSAWW